MSNFCAPGWALWVCPIFVHVELLRSWLSLLVGVKNCTCRTFALLAPTFVGWPLFCTCRTFALLALTFCGWLLFKLTFKPPKGGLKIVHVELLRSWLSFVGLSYFCTCRTFALLAFIVGWCQKLYMSNFCAPGSYVCRLASFLYMSNFCAPGSHLLWVAPF